MKIQLRDVIPAPLHDRPVDNSDIWLSDITFKDGKQYHVAAPSGSGKSTFILSLYGLRNDYSGTITYDGQNVRQFTINDWSTYRQKKIAIVFQDLRLFSNLSAFDNILVNANLAGSTSESRIREMAESLRILKVLDKPTFQLSQGERQRVAIIRALCQPFQWLWLDEPFSHLDDSNTARAVELIKMEVEQSKAGMIIAQLDRDEWFPYDEMLNL